MNPKEAENRIKALEEGAAAAQAEIQILIERLAALTATVEELTAKIEGRNRSAPTKRNMTDADAVRVLNGDQKDAGHKEAAEAVGLTYAQVYSCRLGFTFKHVIRELEKSGWKSKWARA